MGAEYDVGIREGGSRKAKGGKEIDSRVAIRDPRVTGLKVILHTSSFLLSKVGRRGRATRRLETKRLGHAVN